MFSSVSYYHRSGSTNTLIRDLVVVALPSNGMKLDVQPWCLTEG